MSVAFALSLSFVTETCCHKDCGIAFAMTKAEYDLRRQDRASFYCPRGHSQHYTGETEEQKLKRMLETERVNSDWWMKRSQHKDRQLSAKKGQITRIKNRVGNGVCPCCRRSFQNLMRHMKTQHPKFKDEKE